MSGWENIIAVAASSEHTVGLHSDGTLVATGNNDYGQCNLDGWKLFNSADDLEQERMESRSLVDGKRKETAMREQQEVAEREQRMAAERAEGFRQQRIDALSDEQIKLNDELTSIKGLFSGKRRKEIEARLTEIDAELKRLQ